MIVDDELLVRLALRASIEWEDYNMELVAEAEDGLEASEYIEKFRPHIVITDLSMPGMSGIELIRETKAKYPEIEFIVLSCHNEYEYVREAMKLGAADYILKLSMDMDELIKTIVNLRDKMTISKPKESQDPLSEYKGKWQEIILQALRGGSPSRKIYGAEKLSYRIVLFESDSFENEEINTSGYKALEGIIEEVYGRDEKAIIIPIDHRRHLLVFKYALEDFSRADTINVENLNQVITLAYDYLKINMSCGISSVVSDISQIKEAYTEAYSALKRKFYSGPQSINAYESKKILEIRNASNSEEITNHINMLKKEKIDKYLDGFFRHLKEKQDMHPKVLKKYCHEVLLSLSKNASELFDTAITFDSIEEGYHEIDTAIYIEEIESIMATRLEEFWEEFDNLSHSAYRKEVMVAKNYISQHYDQQINIKEVSNYVDLSADYFSHIFKKEVGISFSKYLNKIRIEKAKILMRSKNLKVYEVAHRVGYENESYFTRKFKSSVGITPLEYINQEKTDN